MKDTSLKNTLFQAEFNTDIQLADVMRFVADRYELGELLSDLQKSPAEIADAIVEMQIGMEVADELNFRGYKVD